MRFPESYSNLADAGITEDYSMGFPEEPGFRAGIARPYSWYDLKNEKKTGLRITPFQVMDGAFFRYKQTTPGESDAYIAELINETRKAGGLFVSIWHNTSLLNNSEWLMWRNTFELMLKLQQS
jgi:hypothetical protein